MRVRPDAPINCELGVRVDAYISLGVKFVILASLDTAFVVPLALTRYTCIPVIGRVVAGLLKFET